ncbi:DUF4397 domain-containing protein [Mucilaginibacter celer]|uniref:DUF4397 domain-containing protein n=2 Tax=Mucilaginibacter celer TaxID=2305508 RepID=A0A494VZC5_9SPHI|nr:DUF4397 domain-containing protein [Mucilaginibacter celer]
MPAGYVKLKYQFTTHILYFMKTVQQKLTRRAGIIGMMCLLAATLSSCLKNDHHDYVEQPVALVSVINASPDAGGIDFVLQPNRANNFPIRYGDVLDYIRANPGKRTASFYDAASGQKIAEDTVTLTTKKFYSLYIANVANAAGKRDVIFVADSLKQPAAGMASIRLANLSPDAGSIDLVTSKDSVLATNKAYKGVSDFVTIKAASNYTLNIREKGTTTILATLTNVNLHANAVYTVWLQGLAAATDYKKLTADIQNNVYYY